MRALFGTPFLPIKNVLNRAPQWHKRIVVHVVLCSALLPYLLVGYNYARTNTLPLQLCFVALFALYGVLLSKKNLSLSCIFFYGALYRVLFLFAVPVLSDDFYRFLWDGMLWQQGINPFAHPPAHYAENSEGGFSLLLQQGEWYEKMNSKAYFSIYPPILQAVFWLTSFFATKPLYALCLMRLVQCAAECATVYIMLQWLKKHHQPLKKVAYYVLNPLVIIECAGNVHFEALLIFFLVWTMCSIESRRLYQAACALAAAVAIKLHPLLLLVYCLRAVKWKFVFLWVFVGSLLVLFSPLFLHGIHEPAWLYGMGHSVSLYFNHFTFHASLYEIIKYCLYVLGSDTQAGFITAAIGAGGILYLSLKGTKNAHKMFTLLYTVYLLTSTTVHPWYVTPLVGFSVLSGFHFPLLWSYTTLWSYMGYTTTGYLMPWYWQVMGYFFVISCLLYELFYHRRLARHLSYRSVRPLDR